MHHEAIKAQPPLQEEKTSPKLITRVAILLWASLEAITGPFCVFQLDVPYYTHRDTVAIIIDKAECCKSSISAMPTPLKAITVQTAWGLSMCPAQQRRSTNQVTPACSIYLCTWKAQVHAGGRCSGWYPAACLASSRAPGAQQSVTYCLPVHCQCSLAAKLTGAAWAHHAA